MTTTTRTAEMREAGVDAGEKPPVLAMTEMLLATSGSGAHLF